MKTKEQFRLFIRKMRFKLYKPFSRRSLNRFLEEELQKITANSCKLQKKKFRVLNIGAGGDFYKIIKKNPYIQIEQLDIDPNRQPDILADASKMVSIKSGTYDYVFAMEVLEHVPTPQAAVDEIFRVLKADGNFIFSTPFIFPIHEAPNDYYRYTYYGLKYLLRSFDNVEIKEKNNYIQAIALLYFRTIVIGNKKELLASILIYSAAILTYPIWFFISCIFDSKLACSGYYGSAMKKADKFNE